MNGVSAVVETVIADKVQADEMFTAHDVTLEVRNRGHRAKHGDVRDCVHDCYGRGLMGVAYTRTSITVPTGDTPFLYHRRVDDPNTYNNVRATASNWNPSIPSLNSLIGGAVQPVAQTAQKTSNIGKLNDRSVDARGTLSIPTALLKNIGIKAGETVYAVAVAGPALEVISAASVPVGVFGKYTVDGHNQVRITQNLLQRAGIAGKSYDISENNNKIVVKLAA